MVEKNNNEVYFVNNLYDDTLVNNFVSIFRNRLYYTILRAKKHIQNNCIHSGSLSDFEVDVDLNDKYDVAKGSYSLQLAYNVIPYFSEEVFLTEYGYDAPVLSSDISVDTKVFNKSFHLYIGDYFVFECVLVMTRNGSIIFIPDSEYLQASKVKTLVEEDASWKILLKTKSDYYYGYLERTILFNGNKIYTSNLSEHVKFNKQIKNNHWTLHVTATTSSLNLMAVSNVTLHSDASGDYFLVDEEFKNSIFEISANMKCLITNEPEYSGSGIYKYSDDTVPVFQIPFVSNPIPVDNLIVWSYDKQTHRKLHPLINEVTLSYPNIYDFSEMIDEHDLCIEWLEPQNDISAYDSYIQDFIDCYGNAYSTKLLNGDVPEEIANYQPIEDIAITSENYFNSPLKGDARAWKLDKLITLLKDNPHRYTEMMKKMYVKSREFVSKTYTFEEYPHIYERRVMNTTKECGGCPQHYKVFDKPQCYVKVHNSSWKARHANLFINGVYTPITFSFTDKSDMYIYFPCISVINNETIHVDIGLDNESINDEVFPFDISGGYYPFSKSDNLENNAIADLMFYNNTTGKYVESKDIHYKLRIESSTIKFNGTDKDDTITTLDLSEILHDVYKLMIEPTDYNYIVLDPKSVEIELSKTTYYKKIDLDNLLVNITIPNYAYDEIHCTTVNFYKEDIVEIKDTTKTFMLYNFKGKPNKNRFRIFINGRLQDPSSYNIAFTTKYINPIIFENISLETGTAYIEYISYDEKIIFNDKIATLKMDNNIIKLNDVIEIPFDLSIYKLYIDGYRVPSTSITTIGECTAIIIDDLPFDNTNNSTLTIYQQCMDDDPYEYDASSLFLTKLYEEDDTLRNYVITKYSH